MIERRVVSQMSQNIKRLDVHQTAHLEKIEEACSQRPKTQYNEILKTHGR